MIQLMGNWTEEDIKLYIKNNPNKIVNVKYQVFVRDLNEKMEEIIK